MQQKEPSNLRQTSSTRSRSFFACLDCFIQQDQILIMRENVDKLKIRKQTKQQKYSIKSRKHPRKTSSMNPQEESLKITSSPYRNDIDFMSQHNRQTSNLTSVSLGYAQQIPDRNYSFAMPSLQSKDSMRTTNDTNLRFSQNGQENRYRMKQYENFMGLQKKRSIKFAYSNRIEEEKKTFIPAYNSQPNLQKINEPSIQNTNAWTSLSHPPLLNNSILFGINQNIFEPEESVLLGPSKQLTNLNQQSREILVSLELIKKSSGNSSNFHSTKLKHKKSMNQALFHGKMKVRQTNSILSRAESEDHISYVVTQSMCNSGLNPIEQHEWAELSLYQN